MHSLSDRTGRRTGPAHALSVLLRVYLALSLAGCAANRPLPTREEAREMETRTLAADSAQAFDAVVASLQDLDFNIDAAQPACGLIVAHRESERELAEISQDVQPDSSEGMPTWAKVALIATGVIVVVAIVAAVSQDDDDRAGDKDGRGLHHAARHHDKRHHDSHSTEIVVVDSDSHPSGPPIYRYEITVNLKAISGHETRLRVSGQGSMSRDGSILRAGPIHDAGFFGRFFGQLDQSLAALGCLARPGDGEVCPPKQLLWQ